MRLPRLRVGVRLWVGRVQSGIGVDFAPCSGGRAICIHVCGMPQVQPCMNHAGDLLLSRAPGRLDVMGGIADYSGSLVLQEKSSRECTCLQADVACHSPCPRRDCPKTAARSRPIPSVPPSHVSSSPHPPLRHRIGLVVRSGPPHGQRSVAACADADRGSNDGGGAKAARLE